MPYADYLELQEFYAIEPWGVSVQDAMQAHLASVLANVNRDSRQHPEPYKLSDFLLYHAPPQEDHVSEPDHPRVQGLTAHQWKMLLFFQALQAKQEREKAFEQTN
ncbi:phage tail assembly protein T [Undibacterium sp. Rencai35W]|uniref:phage tail assembly protein T n=1 Tax=Undibacterium sp. Rencai35W TaxID=3413046 RepID=UPI003BF14295